MDLNYYIHTGKTVHEKLDKNLYVAWLCVPAKLGLVPFDCKLVCQIALWTMTFNKKRPPYVLTHTAVPPCCNDVLIQRIERTLICLFKSTGLALCIPLYLHGHVTLTMPPSLHTKGGDSLCIDPATRENYNIPIWKH